MRFLKVGFTLDPKAKTTLADQISEGLVRLIREGRLKSGDALPSSRLMAEDLSVDRSTVLAAMNELRAEGWIETRPGSGSFVAELQPNHTPIGWGSPADSPKKSTDLPGFDIPSRFSPLTPLLPGPFNLGHAARLDARLAPVEQLAKAYQRGVRLHGTKLLEYGEPRGNALLREEIANMLARRRGLTVNPDQILITRGNRMALHLVATALLQDGGRAAVEDPGHPSIRDTLRQIPKAELLPVPVDGEGLDLESLRKIVESRGIRLVHLTPHPQDPTGVLLEKQRRRGLLELAQEHRFAVVEDGSDFENRYEGAAPLPLAAEDVGGNVVYLGSFSRMFAPGLRLGFLVAPKGVIERLARIRQRMEWQGDRALEWAVADLLRDGVLDRHALRSRKVYQERRDLLLGHMQAIFGSRLVFESPAAGLGVWVRGAEGFSVSAWIAACKKTGILVPDGSSFDFHGRAINATRIGFAAIDLEEIAQIARGFASSLAAMES
jgi:GntR family transcriptional regulator/MocR family aminotransferase